LSNI
jgi:hypothetical protein